jgi:hypothetical protein
MGRQVRAVLQHLKGLRNNRTIAVKLRHPLPHAGESRRNERVLNSGSEILLCLRKQTILRPERALGL